jgi:hypothetical protein
MISSYEFGMLRKGRLTQTWPVTTLQGLRERSEPFSQFETSWVGWNSCWGDVIRETAYTAREMQ